jgi:hypothetical protein
MWSTALCTLGVTKPMNLCNCLTFRQQHNHTVLHNITNMLFLMSFYIINTKKKLSAHSRSLEERDL